MSRQSESKVVGIGFHKTGTSSLDTVLEMLGYAVYGCKIRLVKDICEGDLSSALEKARYGLDKYTRPRNLKKVWRDFLFRRAGKVKSL